VVDLFNQLSLALEEACDLGRREHETPREYLERFGAALRLELRSLRVLVDVFCEAFYGQKGIAGARAAAFREAVVLVVEIARKKASAAPPA
jgi:hypothetical protein